VHKTLVLNESYRNGPELYISKGRGPWLYDTKGRKYLDLMLGCGTNILGHANPIINSVLEKNKTTSILPIAPNIYTEEFAELLAEISGMNGIIFCSSGTEATMRAMRIARAHTQKTKIAIFSGGWHGGHDYALQEENSDSPPPKFKFKSSGVPEQMAECTLFLPYNCEDTFSILEQHKDELAMVFIEPIQGSNPQQDIGGFLHKLREFTRANNILLGFDEIITGFRLSLGGGKEYFQVSPDIITYGKIVGGGLPIGVTVVNDSLIDTVIGSSNTSVFLGGTFSANPLVMQTGFAQISYLRDNIDIYNKLETKTLFIKEQINNFCKKNDIAAHVMQVASIFRIIFTDISIRSRHERDKFEIKRDKQLLFYKRLRQDGLMVNNNGINFISTSHTDANINTVIDKINKQLMQMKTDNHLVARDSFNYVD